MLIIFLAFSIVLSLKYMFQGRLLVLVIVAGVKVSMNMPVKVLTGPGVIQSAFVCPVWVEAVGESRRCG